MEITVYVYSHANHSERLWMLWHGAAVYKYRPPAIARNRLVIWNDGGSRWRVSLEKWVKDSWWNGKTPLGQLMVKIFGNIQHKLGVEETGSLLGTVMRGIGHEGQNWWVGVGWWYCSWGKSLLIAFGDIDAMTFEKFQEG